MKMKMNFKYALMAFAALMLGATSCSNEDDGGNALPEDGEEAYVTINLKQEGAATRAVASYTATAEEKAIYNAKVYVFSSNKVLQQIEDLTVNGTNDGASKTFKTTVGDHYFLAVANTNPNANVNVPLGTSIDNLVQQIEQVNQNKFESFLDPGAADGNLANTRKSGFFMTSGLNTEEGTPEWYKTIEYKFQTIVPDANTSGTVLDANKVIIPIGRAMGKTTVTIPTTNYNAVDASNTVLGTISNPVFSVGNNPVAMYYFPFFGTLQQFQTPHWTFYSGTTVPNTYWPALHAGNFGSATYNETITNGHSFAYKPAATKTTRTAVEDLASTFYLVENSNAYPTYGNSTIAQVKATFLPAAFEDAAVAAGVTFYRVWQVINTATGEGQFVSSAPTTTGFWSTKAAIYAHYGVADDAGLASTGLYINTYKDGICYYMIPLRNTYFSSSQTNNDPIVYSVMRNHYYDVTVNKITDCGYPGPGGKDPDDPNTPPGPGDQTEPEDPLDPEGTPFIEVSIEVKDWVWVKQGEEIGIRD